MGDENELINQDEIERLLQQSLAQAPSKAGPQAVPAGKPPPAAEPIQRASPGGKPASAAATATLAGKEEEDRAVGQGEINLLLSQAGISAAPPAKPQPAKGSPPPAQARSEPGIAQNDIEALLHKAEEALSSLDEASSTPMPPGATSFHWQELSGAAANSESATLELIRDVELDLKIELGRTQMYLEDVLKLRRGSVVTLDKLAGDPVDIFVNGRLIARGEVLVLNDNFCVRVAELVAGVNSQ
jgi:flagellar motor switch protein FliN/FliY